MVCPGRSHDNWRKKQCQRGHANEAESRGTKGDEREEGDEMGDEEEDSERSSYGASRRGECLHGRGRGSTLASSVEHARKTRAPLLPLGNSSQMVSR
jgi:hypothetical protein